MIIKRLFRKLLRSTIIDGSKISVNWWRTLLINFYFLPFSQARKFPIFVYGKLRIPKIQGSIMIALPASKVYRGMIKLNLQTDASGAPGGDMAIHLGDGSIIFEGRTQIAQNSKLLLWNGGQLIIGNGTYINQSCNIACSTKIIIGDNTRFGPEVQIFDTNFHFTYNTDDLKVKRNNRPVILGHHCWVGARSTIMKGIKLPDYTIVASNSLVNKNVVDKERCLIAGSPAKFTKEGFSRVFKFTEECNIAGFFNNNPEATEYELTEPISQYDD